VEDRNEGERCLRRVPEEERHERWHLQQEVEPFCASVMRQQLVMKLFEGFEGQGWSRWWGLRDSVPRPILRREGAN
jgi:hypothetical protein